MVSQNSNQESGVVQQRKNFDFFIHNNSLGFIEKDAKILFYVYSDFVPEPEPGKKPDPTSQFTRLNKEYIETLNQFEKYLSFIQPQNQPDFLIVYGLGPNQQLSFNFYKINRTEKVVVQKEVKKKTFEVTFESDQFSFKKVVKGSQKANLLHVQMDPQMNFFLCCYDNGAVTRVS